MVIPAARRQIAMVPHEHQDFRLLDDAKSLELQTKRRRIKDMIRSHQIPVAIRRPFATPGEVRSRD